MAPILIHPSLHATLEGIEVKLDDQTSVHHYRGIQYANITRRFSKAVSVDDWSSTTLDCTRFG